MAYNILNFVSWLISLVPMKLLILLSHPLGWLTWKLSKTKRSSTLKNLRSCYPEMSAPERLVLAKESMRYYVLNILETGVAWHGSAARIDRLFDEPVGFEHLLSAQAEGRGVLLLVPHFGNWEINSHWVQKYFKLVSLYKPGSNSSFDAKLLAKRKRLGAGMVPANRSGLKRIYKCINEGETVAILPDQEPSAGQGRFAPFFGIPALTGVLASRLLQSTGCLALFVVGRRTRKGRIQAHFLPAEEQIYSADMDESLAALNRGVERCVEIDRAQYLWAYKRFKKRPEGEPRFYNK
jgi:KDO2-lipid IV(A) lauroyltransferase